MAMRMYNNRLFSKLSSYLKFPLHECNYSQREVSRFSDDDYPRQPSKFVNILAYLHRNTVSWAEVKADFKWKQEQDMREHQSFLPEVHKALGPDLAAAHFITRCGGKVKFHGRNVWMTYENVTKNEIPPYFVPKMYLEAVDASDTNLCYEGFDNFTFLPHIKELILRNCPYIDDWCMHRMRLFEGSLQHLDISGCQNVSDRGICTLHNLKKLKVLTLNDTPKVANKELVCLLLQEILPELNIIGVDYSNPSLWERLKEYLN